MIKGTDNRPLNREFLGRNDMGPDSMNLLIPNELEKRLKRNVSKGRAEVKPLYVGIMRPNSFFGKKPCVANNMAREMFTYQNNLQFVCCNEIGLTYYKCFIIMKLLKM